jgi:hypothetical protein
VLAALGVAAHVVARRRLGPSPRREWLPWAFVLVAAAAGLAAWVLLVAHNTYNYLRPYASAATHQLLGQASGSGGGRAVYGGSVQPVYERLLGGLGPVVLLAILVAGVFASRGFRGWPARRTVVALACFGVVYFLSIPFILAPSGAEGARRSWGFTYLGVAVCVAAVVGPWLWARPRRRRTMAVAAVALAALFIGNTGAGLNDAYRFPGPYLFGSDTRSLTTEAVGLGRAFGGLYAGARVVTDRYTALPLVAYGDAFTASPSAGFPTYDLFLHTTTPAPFLVHELTSSDYRYLVVDRRLSRFVPEARTYFTTNEPIEHGGTTSQVPAAALRRFDTVPWATKVMSTTNFSVYRLNFGAAGVPSCTVPGCTAVAP